MSKSKFPEHLTLDKRAAQEIDMNGNEHVWVPSSPEQQQWLRMSIRDQAEITGQNEGASSLAVRIQEFREFKRTFMQKLLRTVPDNVVDAPIGPDGAKVELSVLGKSRKALLVWAKQSGLQLDPEAVSRLFPNINSQQELLDAWLVETTDGTFLPSLTPMQREVAELSDRIIEAIGKFGVVVGDINQLQADRVCVCLKQDHGAIESFKAMLSVAELLRTWFQHQGNIVRLQQAITEIAGKENFQLFIEHIREDDIMVPLPASLIQSNERRYAIAEHDEDEALGIIVNILSADHDGQHKTAIALHRSVTGMMRGAFQLLSENSALRSRMHGLHYPGRIELWKEAEEVRDVELVRQDFDRVNRYLLQQVSTYLGIGECGIILLGGLHFRPGMTPPPETNVNAVPPDNPIFDEKLKVESYIEKNDSLRNIRFIIVEPHGYQV